MSSTYYELKDIVDTNIFDNPNGEIDNGKLILIKDDGVVKIGRGVNSFTTTTITKGEEFKKIRIVEITDMIKDDIYKTMKKQYIGKVINIYDNKIKDIEMISVNVNGSRTIRKKNNAYLESFDYAYVKNELKDLMIRK